MKKAKVFRETGLADELGSSCVTVTVGSKDQVTGQVADQDKSGNIEEIHIRLIKWRWPYWTNQTAVIRNIKR